MNPVCGFAARARVAFSGLLVVACLGAGCVGYRLGSMLPPDIRTVFVPTVINESGEPLIEADATRALIARIQTDGSLRVEREDAADAVLRVTLRGYRMEGIAFDRGPSARPNEYRIVLTASMALVSTRTGEVIAEYPAARGEATVEVTGDPSASKRDALPRVSEDLARDIVRRMVEAW